MHPLGTMLATVLLLQWFVARPRHAAFAAAEGVSSDPIADWLVAQGLEDSSDPGSASRRAAEALRAAGLHGLDDVQRAVADGHTELKKLPGLLKQNTGAGLNMRERKRYIC